MKHFRYWLLLSMLMAVFLTSSIVRAQGTSQQIISIGFARRILTAALAVHGLTKLPAFDLEPYDGKDSRFYFFEADWDTPASAVAGGVGHYAVNRVTGGAWEIMACEALTSPTTRKLQLDIKKSLRVRPDEYEKLRTVKPCP